MTQLTLFSDTELEQSDINRIRMYTQSLEKLGWLRRIQGKTSNFFQCQVELVKLIYKLERNNNE